MKITQEKLPASQVGLEIEIPSETSQQTYNRVIQQFARSLNIPGFRKGKVPRHVLLQRLGSTQIKQTVLEELIQNSLKQAFDETQLIPLATPEMRIPFERLLKEYEPGNAFCFGVVFDVKPEVTLNVYQGFDVKAEEVLFDSAKVDAVIEEYRERVATWVPVENRTAQRKDAAIVDYHGRISDVDLEADPEAAEFPGNQEQDFQVELEADRFVEGFIEGIIGMSIGETKEVPVQFPMGYALPKVSGHAVIFTITLKELKERELPDVDDDFAKDISAFETLEELRASLTERYQAEAKQKTRKNQEDAIAKALLRQIQVDLPETLIRQQVDFLLNQTAAHLQSQGVDVEKLFTPENVPVFREQSRVDAIIGLKQSFGLFEVAEKESITVDEDALQARMRQIIQNSPEQKFDPERLHEIVTEELLTQNVMDWLIAHSTVTLVAPGSLTTATTEANLAADSAPNISALSEASEANLTASAPESDLHPELAEIPQPVVDVADSGAAVAETEAPEMDVKEVEDSDPLSSPTPAKEDEKVANYNEE